MATTPAQTLSRNCDLTVQAKEELAPPLAPMHRLAPLFARVIPLSGAGTLSGLCFWLLSWAAGAWYAYQPNALAAGEWESAAWRMVLPGIISGMLFLLLALVNALVKVYNIRVNDRQQYRTHETSNFQKVVDGLEMLREREAAAHQAALVAQRAAFLLEQRELRAHFEEREAILRADRHRVAGLAQACINRLAVLEQTGRITAAEARMDESGAAIEELAQPGLSDDRRSA